MHLPMPNWGTVITQRRGLAHVGPHAVCGDRSSVQARPAPSMPMNRQEQFVPQASPAFWQVLHFGFQNLLDPALDEWAVMEKLEETPGQIALPPECAGKCAGDGPAFPPGFFCK